MWGGKAGRWLGASLRVLPKNCPVQSALWLTSPREPAWPVTLSGTGETWLLLRPQWKFCGFPQPFHPGTSHDGVVQLWWIWCVDSNVLHGAQERGAHLACSGHDAFGSHQNYLPTWLQQDPGLFLGFIHIVISCSYLCSLNYLFTPCSGFHVLWICGRF